MFFKKKKMCLFKKKTKKMTKSVKFRSPELSPEVQIPLGGPETARDKKP